MSCIRVVRCFALGLVDVLYLGCSMSCIRVVRRLALGLIDVLY